MGGILGSIGKFLGECVTGILESNWDSTQREVFGLEKTLSEYEKNGTVLSDGEKAYFEFEIKKWMENLPNEQQLSRISDDDTYRYYNFLSKSIIRSYEIMERISQRR